MCMPGQHRDISLSRAVGLSLSARPPPLPPQKILHRGTTMAQRRAQSRLPRSTRCSGRRCTARGTGAQPSGPNPKAVHHGDQYPCPFPSLPTPLRRHQIPGRVRMLPAPQAWTPHAGRAMHRRPHGHAHLHTLTGEGRGRGSTRGSQPSPLPSELCAHWCGKGRSSHDFCSRESLDSISLQNRSKAK